MKIGSLVLVTVCPWQYGGRLKWISSVITEKWFDWKCCCCSWLQIFHQQLPHMTSWCVCMCMYMYRSSTFRQQWGIADFSPCLASSCRWVSYFDSREYKSHASHRHTGLRRWYMSIFVQCILLICNWLYRSSELGSYVISLIFCKIEKWIWCVLVHREADLLQPSILPESLLCSFPQVPLFIPISFTVICLFTVAMSFYSDPVNISIGCTIVLSGFPVYYLIIHKQMSNCFSSPLCKYTFQFEYCGPKITLRGGGVSLVSGLISDASCSMTNRLQET